MIRRDGAQEDSQSRPAHYDSSIVGRTHINQHIAIAKSGLSTTKDGCEVDIDLSGYM
jgi:hypothetical protein